MSVGLIDGNVTKLYMQDITVDLPSVAANTSAETTVTVVGLKTTDFVAVNKPSLEAGIAIGNARVSAANTLALTIINATAGAVDAASETYKLFVVSKEGA